jgi:hypothetical protein
MAHFSTQEWIDFARQAEGADRARAMQKHLDDGCIPCAKNLAVWRRIMKLAQHDRNEQAPASSIHMVKASFGMRNFGLAKAGKLELATLVMDSMQPTPAYGIRGSFPAARQLLYRAGTVCIDLHIRPKPGSEEVVLVGQLMDSMKPAKCMSNVPVALLQHGNSVSSKKTNDLGEFDFGFETPEDVHLAFGLDNRTLVVPIPDSTDETHTNVGRN